ncbi:MAG TPA: MBL fold metallo-hydrolase [Conexivisphaerales archaeon]|nr:MBL fold metallo-hydrolase [Conexivisphaerales archaeon]
MQVRVLGAANEVGRSAVLVESNGSRLLLDYGVKLAKEPEYPIHIRPKDIDALVLSHAHLDHVGAAPLFYLSAGPPLSSTPVTLELSKVLLRDFLKISGQILPFDEDAISNMAERSKLSDLGDHFKVGKVNVSFRDAGHIPGSAITIIEGDKKAIYTGDMNRTPTQLLNPADVDGLDADVMITESTYSQADHPDRKKEEERFVKYAEQIVDDGGTLLVPSFAVGRAQELACILYSHGFKHRVYMDGMALKTNEILLEHPESVRDPTLLQRALGKVQFVEDWGARKRAVADASVIISPAGMLVGGFSTFYNKSIAKNKRNGIAIVSFQVPGTPGRTLLEKREVKLDGKRYKVSADVQRFDFSSHLGMTELFDLFKEKVKGSPKVIVVHGERENSEQFARRLREELGLDAVSPEAGEEFEI